MMRRNQHFRRSPIPVIMATLLVVAVLPATVVSAAETAPLVTWNVTFSPEENNKFDAVANTADGGYIVRWLYASRRPTGAGKTCCS